jgi:hypothetical protein
MQMIECFIIAQIKRDKTPTFTAEPLNNFSVSFQVSVPFNYGPGVQPISLTSSEPEFALPHSQVPANCVYPEPAQSSPCPHIPLPEDLS